MGITGVLVILWVWFMVNGKSVMARGFQLSAVWYTYTILIDAYKVDNWKYALSQFAIMVIIFAPSVLPYVARFLLKIIREVLESDKDEKGELPKQATKERSVDTSADTKEKENRISRILAELSKQKEE
jgi:Sec-independent protein translocase protein TatA